MAHAISLFFGLGLLWMLLSGLFEPLLLGFGLASCAFVVLLTWRLETLDHESMPTHVLLSAFWYWPWLGWQIVLANFDVAKRILSPSMKLAPEIVRLTSTQHSDLGKVIYANSITLTPGTVTIDIEGDQFLVHGIARNVVEDLEDGAMDRRVSNMEGGS